MAIPTREEYEQAKGKVESIKNWIRYEQETIDGLLDRIIQCRQTIAKYKEAIRSNRNVIDAYEAYQKILKEK